MAYEVDYADFDMAAVDFESLLPQAYEAAGSRIATRLNYWFAISLGRRWFTFLTNVETPQWAWREDVSELRPRCEIHLDPRYLHGILTRKYHWNNAEVGSQLKLRREPEEYNMAAFHFLRFVHL